MMAFRPAVRANFAKVLMCRTEALGSEVYTSNTEQKIVHHTCKSPCLPKLRIPCNQNLATQPVCFIAGRRLCRSSLHHA